MSSRIPYPDYNGVTTAYTVSFGFLDRLHVNVTADDVPVPFRWTGDSSIELITPPAAGTNLVIFRDTPRSPLVAFSLGSTLSRKELDILAKQAVFLAEEALDRIQNGVSFDDLTGTLNAQGFRLSNLDDPVDPQDAATKFWVEQLVSALPNLVTDAEESAVASQLARLASETARDASQAAAAAAVGAAEEVEDALAGISNPYTDTLNGLVPAPGAGSGSRKLRADGTWAVDPAPPVVPGAFPASSPGLVPSPGAGSSDRLLTAGGAWLDVGIRRAINDWWAETWFSNPTSPSGPQFQFSPILGGTVSDLALAADARVWGQGIHLRSAATANSGVRFSGNLTGSLSRFDKKMVCRLRAVHLGNVAGKPTIRVGWHNSTSFSAPTQGAWFELRPESGAQVFSVSWNYKALSGAATSSIPVSLETGGSCNLLLEIDYLHGDTGTAGRRLRFRVRQLLDGFGPLVVNTVMDVVVNDAAGNGFPQPSEVPPLSIVSTTGPASVLNHCTLYSLGEGTLRGFYRANGID